MEPNWSTGGTSSKTGGSSSSTHNPSSFVPYTDAGGSSSSTYVSYPPYNYAPPPYHSSSSYAIDYSGFAPYTHAHMPVIVVQVGILIPFLLTIPHILNF